MGTRSDDGNEFVPFQINYIPIYDHENPFIINTSTIPCSKSYNVRKRILISVPLKVIIIFLQESFFPGCSCIDCEDSCKTGTAPEEDEEEFTIFELSGIAFICAIVLFCISLLGVLVIIIKNVRRNRNYKNSKYIIIGIVSWGVNICIIKYFFVDNEDEFDEDYVPKQSCLTKFGAKINCKIEEFFREWGSRTFIY